MQVRHATLYGVFKVFSFCVENSQSCMGSGDRRGDVAVLGEPDLEWLRERIQSAVSQEWPQVSLLLQDARRLEVRELGWRTASAVAPVASDGGEAGLTFDPMKLEFIRVVDSDGQVHMQEVIPLSGGPGGLREVLRREPVVELARRIGADDPCEISFFLSEIKGDEWPPNMPSAHVRNVVAHIRDIVEWSVLLKLAWEPVRGRRLIIRDGLLRTLALTREAVQRMAGSFQAAHDAHGALIVGVAKRSQLLSYISLALQLEGTFRRPYRCFAPVPEELQRKAYKGQNWLGGYGFGLLHLAKLAEDPDAMVLPVDVPPWLEDRRTETLEYLAATSQGSFPHVGYPYPLVQAHERATLGTFDVSVVADMLVQAVMAGRSPAEAERILRHVTLGRGLAKGGFQD